MRNKSNKVLSMILLLVMFTSIVSAFGVSAPYWDGKNPNPLYMARGESKTINLNLQNMVGEKDVEVMGVLVEGSDIAIFKQDKFSVKAQTSDVNAPLKIIIPKEMPAETTKKVVVEFKTISSDEEGMVTMGTGVEVSFDVIVTEEIVKPKISLGMIVSLIIGIILLGGIIWIILKKKKHKKKSHKKK